MSRRIDLPRTTIEQPQVRAQDAPSSQHKLVFQHDGSFAGFLCALAEGLNELLSQSRADTAKIPEQSIDHSPDQVPTGNYARRIYQTPAKIPGSHQNHNKMRLPVIRSCTAGTDLFEEPEPVRTDSQRADATWSRLAGRLGSAFMQTLLAAFCSDIPGSDSVAATVAMRGWLEGSRVLDDLGDPDSCAVEKAAVRTRAEAHLMLGAVRFAELADGSWYARIQPSCDVLMHIAGHFSARYPGMRWAIHDTGRAKAIIHVPSMGWSLAKGFTLGDNADQESLFSADEARVRETWRQYFGAVTIQSRLNPRLQAGHLPKRYWENLPEMTNSEQ
jgi:probable DNA metabolism protein